MKFGDGALTLGRLGPLQCRGADCPAGQLYISPAMPSLTAAQAHLEALGRMTPEAKLAVLDQLRRTAWDLTAAGVRLREPDLDEEAIQQRVRAIFLRADT